jgi:carbon-monoxide dehydrogenase medium subunit
MKRLQRFSYTEPTTLAEAVAALAAGGDGARSLAGGTDLVVDMKTERVLPTTVVNLKRIPGLSGIEAVDGGTRIGALTKVTAVERSEVVRRRHPALAQAAAVLATPPIRAVATIGGNIGRASPASDLAPPLIVHRAVATVEGADGRREEPVEGLFAGPGETTLAHHDIITSFFLPLPGPGFGSAHRKIGARGGGTDIAVVGVSAAVAVEDGERVADARIVLASVAPVPMRAAEAESVLKGTTASDEILAAAAEAAAGECRPVTDLRAGARHRTALTRVLTMRALTDALIAARGREAA